MKIFSVEHWLGMEPINLTFFGQKGLSFNMTAGVLLWPVVFVMTDIINEYFGRKGVRQLTYIAVALICYAYLIVLLAIELPPADFWVGSKLEGFGITDFNAAFAAVFGQGLWIIIGSLVAFLIGQLVDVITFQRIRAITGENKIWLRATGSTLVSQFIDSFVVLFIAFYVGADWPLVLVLAIGLVNYIYKVAVAIILTPVLYIAHYAIDGFLGKELSKELTDAAASEG